MNSDGIRENGLSQLMRVLMGTPCWAKCAPEISQYQEILTTADAEQLLGQMAQTYTDSSSTRLINAIRHLIQDTRDLGIRQALARRTSRQPFIEEWESLEKPQDGDRILRWEHLLAHPDLEILPAEFEAEMMNRTAAAYFQRGEPQDVLRAVENWERAIAIVGVTGEGFSYRTNLGMALRRQPGMMTRSVALHREALALVPPDDRRELDVLTQLEHSLRELFKQNGDPTIVRELIGLGERRAQLDPSHSLGSVIQLASWMYELFSQMEDPSLIDGSIEIMHLGLHLAPAPSRERHVVLGNLGSAYGTRFESRGRIEDLDQAVSLFQQAIQHAQPDSPERLEYQSRLGRALVSRHEHDPNPALLEQGIAILEEVVAKYPPSGESYAHVLNSLVIALSARTQTEKNPADLDRTIDLWQTAIANVSPDSRDALGFQHNIATALLTRFELLRNIEDVERAETICRNLIALGGSDRALQTLFQKTLSNILRTRFENDNDLKILDEAIELIESSAKQAPPAGTDYLTSMEDWCQLLFARYERTAQREDLAQALQIAEDALIRADANAPSRMDLLGVVGRALHQLYEAEGKLSQLDRAVDILQEAVDGTNTNSKNYPNRLNSLALALRSRVHQANIPQRVLQKQRFLDINRAVSAAEVAARMASPSKVSQFLANLSSLLDERVELEGTFAHFRATLHGTDLDFFPESNGQSDDAERAIKCGREAVSSAQGGTFEEFVALNNHGSRLLKVYRETHESAILDESVALLERAQNLGERYPKARVRNSVGLASALEERFRRDGDATDQHRAMELRRSALLHGSPSERLSAAQAQGTIALNAQRWTEAVQAFDTGISAANQLFSVQSLRADKQSWLREARFLWQLAAYARAKSGDLEGAVVTLEEGLARQLRQALLLHGGETELLLEADHQALYKRYVDAVENWRQAIQAAETLRTAEVRESGIVGRLDSAAEILHECIEEIRRVPGFERFQSTLDAAEIRRTARDGPIVFLVPNPIESFAILIPPKLDERIRFVPLPKAFQDQLKAVSGYWQSYDLLLSAKVDGEKRKEALAGLDASLRWLWDAFMDPLIGELGDCQHATLIPSSYLSLMPLHAAWTPDANILCGRCYAQDMVSFSYAASAGALAVSQRLAAKSTCERLLAVSEPQPDGGPPLLQADIEIRESAAKFPQAVILRHEAATKDALLRALPECDVLHFCGHSSANFFDPLQGGLKLAYGQKLTLQEILNLRSRAMKLAFLSACETGVVDLDLPEESVGLPSGLLQAGIAGVCASLWPVHEDSTMLLSSRFFQLWMSEGIPPEAALRSAGAWVRDLTNETLARFFEKEMDLAEKPGGACYELVADRWSRYAAGDSRERPFAHPFYWAAFVFCGASSGSSTRYEDFSRSARPEGLAHPEPVPKLNVASWNFGAPIVQSPNFRHELPAPIGATERVVESFERRGDRNELLHLFLAMPAGTMNASGPSEEMQLVIRVANSLMRSGGASDLVAVARDGKQNDMKRIIAAQVSLDERSGEDGIAILEALAYENTLSAVARLLAARAVARLGRLESAIGIARVTAETCSTDSEVVAKAAMLICEFAEIGLWATPNRRELSPTVPELGIIDSLESIRNQALAAYREGHFDKALQYMTRGIELGDKEPVTFFNRAMIHYRLKRNEEAVADFTAAITADNAYEKAHSQRGLAYAAMERHELAIQDLTRAIQLNDRSAFNYEHRARSYEALGRFTRARQDFAKAAALARESRPEPGLTIRQGAQPRRTVLPRDSAVRALKSIGAVEQVASRLLEAASAPGEGEDYRLAVEGLATLERWGDLRHLAYAVTLRTVVRIEAVLNLHDHGIELADILEQITMDQSASLDDRRRTIRVLADLQDVDGVVAMLLSLGDLAIDFESWSAPARLAADALFSLYGKMREGQLLVLANHPSMPPLVHEISGECLWGLGKRDEGVAVLAKVASLDSAADAVRWSAIYALSKFDRLDAIESTLARLDSPSTSNIELKRRVRSLLLAELESQSATEEEKARRERIWDAVTAARSYEEVKGVVEDDPHYHEDLTFLAFADAKAAGAIDPTAVRNKLAWYREVPRVQAALAMAAYLKAETPEEMKAAAQQYPIMLTESFVNYVQQILDSASSGATRESTELRLSWLIKVPRSKAQIAFEAVRKCPDRATMRNLVKSYPFIRNSRFIAQLDSILLHSSPQQHTEFQERLEWLRGFALGETELELPRAMALHYREGQSQLALEVITELIEKEPEYAEAFFRRAVILGDLRRDEEALADLTRSIELDASVAIVHQVRAKCLFNLGRDIEAIASADHAVELDPDPSEPYNIRAHCWYRREEWELAERDLNYAIERGLSDWLPLFSRGICKWRLGKKEEALGDFDAVLQLQPELPEPIHLKAELLWDLGRKDQALECLSHIRKLGRTRTEEYGYLYEKIVLSESHQEFQRCASALWDADSPDDIAKIASVFPLLLEPDFHDYVEHHLARRAAQRGFSPLGERLAWIRALPGNQASVALWSFRLAGTFEEMKVAVERFPSLAGPDSIRQLEVMIAQAPLEMSRSLREKIEWVRNAPVPPHYQAFFAFQESQSPDDLVRAVEIHPVLCEQELHETISRSIEAAPAELQATLNARLELLKHLTQNSSRKPTDGP
jgi:tetratricopeptide (TPR) repeat protein